MDGGILYLRFVISMAVGMIGVAMVLSRLLDTVLADWDIVADAQAVLDEPGVLKAALADLRIFADETEQPAIAARLDTPGQDALSGREEAAAPMPAFEELAHSPAGEPSIA